MQQRNNAQETKNESRYLTYAANSSGPELNTQIYVSVTTDTTKPPNHNKEIMIDITSAAQNC